MLLPLFALLLVSCEKDDNYLVTEAFAPDQEIAAGDSEKKFNNRKKDVQYTVDLNSLNSSGVSGTATLTVSGDELTVTITASGLTPDMLHPQHIHGFKDNKGNATCPPMSAAGDDGLLTLVDGLPFYGPVLLPLTPFPTDPDGDGEIFYEESFTLSELEFDLKPLQNRVIVLHGMFVDGVYVATLPVACGAISAPMPIN